MDGPTQQMNIIVNYSKLDLLLAKIDSLEKENKQLRQLMNVNISQV